MRSLYMPGRSTVHATNGMAATSQPLSTFTAIQILQQGGNAMDAAIAAVAVQCVVEPQSTGIGGDCFCLYKPHDGELVGFNGSGRAPAAANVQWYCDNSIDQIERQSPHAVTVPGVIDAWEQLSADYGTMQLKDLLQPAIRYADEGFPVNHRVNFDWQLCLDLLSNDPAGAKYYLSDGKAPPIGSIVKLPLLAETLFHIAEQGREGFYDGWVAEDIVAFLRGQGGLHTQEDFANARGEYVTPIKTDYWGYEVYECPPNGQGVVALALLNILAGLDMKNIDPNSAERRHIEIEAARLAYRDREGVIADPAFVDVPVEAWLSENHAARNRDLIDRSKRLADLPPSPLAAAIHNDTVYLTVVDGERNAVSFINTLFYPFGSGLVAPKSGVVLHNRGQGFVLDPDHPNCIAPGKRPLHTIIPGMLMKDGRAQMPFGVMGGHYQAAGHAHLLVNLLDYEMDLQEAIEDTRVFPDFSDGANTVQVEDGMADTVRKELEALGHATYVPDRPIGGAQAIWIDWEEGVLRGGSDPRKDGCAIGF